MSRLFEATTMAPIQENVRWTRYGGRNLPPEKEIGGSLPLAGYASSCEGSIVATTAASIFSKSLKSLSIRILLLATAPDFVPSLTNMYYVQSAG